MTAALLASGGGGLGEQVLAYLVAGLASAAIFAIAASGLVVTYTTSGVFNFAHGAFGMMAAFTYWQLHASSADGGWGLPNWLAVPLVVLVIAPAFGALIERVVMRGLRGSPEVVRIVVTVALMLALLGIAPVIWPDDVARTVAPFFGEHVVMIAGVGVSWHRILTMGAAIAVALGLRFVLFSTRLGTSMRAVVDDPDLARLNGIRPDAVSMASWSLGSSLAALSGVLIASQSGLNAVGLTLLVVNAFAAAVFGRLVSVPRAFVGSIVLGLITSFTVGFAKAGDADVLQRALQSFENKTGLTIANVQPAMPAIVLFVVLWFTRDERSRSHSGPKTMTSARVPSWPLALFGAAALIGATAMVGSLMGDRDRLSLIGGLLFALVVLSLVPLTGYSGQMCLAQMTFFGIGVVSMAHYGVDNPWLGLVIATVGTGVVGAVIALPAMRQRGIYLALLTAAFALLVNILVFKQQKVMPNGSVSVPSLFSAASTTYGRALILATAFSVLGLGVVAVRRSSLGRRLVALRDSPDACATLGMNLVGAKLTVFALSAGIAGMAGALSSQISSSDSFALESSMGVLMLGVVGGIAAVSGALFGGMMMGAFASVFATLFGINRIGWFSVGSVSVGDIMRFTPGLMGMNLGRNPDGATGQAAEGFRPVGEDPVSVGIATVGGVVIWGLARAGVIGNWSFVAAEVGWIFAFVPLLPFLRRDLADRSTLGGRGLRAVAVGLVCVTAIAAFDWSSISSNGWKVIAILAAVILQARFTMAAAGPVPGVTEAAVHDPSPDLVGVEEPFSHAIVVDADRALDLDEARDFAVHDAGIGPAGGPSNAGGPDDSMLAVV